MNKEKGLDLSKDPDFRIKQIEKFNEDKLIIACSRCHHCRR